MSGQIELDKASYDNLMKKLDFVKKKGTEEVFKQCIKILDRNCHSKEINNDETVQNQ